MQSANKLPEVAWYCWRGAQSNILLGISLGPWACDGKFILQSHSLQRGELALPLWYAPYVWSVCTSDIFGTLNRQTGTFKKVRSIFLWTHFAQPFQTKIDSEEIERAGLRLNWYELKSRGALSSTSSRLCPSLWPPTGQFSPLVNALICIAALFLAWAEEAEEAEVGIGDGDWDGWRGDGESRRGARPSPEQR